MAEASPEQMLWKSPDLHALCPTAVLARGLAGSPSGNLLALRHLSPHRRALRFFGGAVSGFLSMRFSAVVAVMAVSLAACAEEFPPCIPLNEELSVCTDVEGLAVSFVDATPTAAMGGVRLQATDAVNVVWAAYWDVDAPLDEYADQLAHAAVRQETGYRLEGPVSSVVERCPAVRYDLVPALRHQEARLPRSILFLDTGAGYAVLNGFARDPSVDLEDLHRATESAARVYRIAE